MSLINAKRSQRKLNDTVFNDKLDSTCYTIACVHLIWYMQSKSRLSKSSPKCVHRGAIGLITMLLAETESLFSLSFQLLPAEGPLSKIQTSLYDSIGMIYNKVKDQVLTVLYCESMSGLVVRAGCSMLLFSGEGIKEELPGYVRP